MSRKQKSRIPLWVRIALVIPLPIIALLIYWAGQNPRTGLFESEALSRQATSAKAVALHFPATLPGSDFRLADTVQFYTSENLYEKIDGHDVAFFRFGFVSLSFALYAGAENVFIDVYVYRMNRRENALGIYGFERSDERDNLAVVDGAYRSGGAMFVYRGPYYIQMIPSEVSPAVELALAEIADSMFQSIPAPGEPIAALSRFPASGRIDNSDGYFPDNAFGTDFVGNIYTTQYSSDEAILTIFRHQSDTAGAMFERYREFLSQIAGVKEKITIEGIDVHRFEQYGEAIWIFAVENVFVGLSGRMSVAEGKQLVGEMIAADR